MTVGMPPKPSQTFIMTKDIALKHSIGAKPSIHTALVPEALYSHNAPFTAKKGSSTYRAGISQSCNTEFQKLAMDVIDITDGWNEAVMMCR